MRKYEHDTFYYGGDIIRAIRRYTVTGPDIDRGGIYVWSIVRRKYFSPLMIYLNLNENDNRGTLEIHQSGIFRAQINGDGVLDLNDNCTDCVFNEAKITDFLSFYLWEDR